MVGVPGEGFTRWTFSGSDIASDSDSTRAFPAIPFPAIPFDNGDTVEFFNPGNFVIDAGVQEQAFPILSGSATVFAGSNSQPLGGLALDSDNIFDEISFLPSDNP